MTVRATRRRPVRLPKRVSCRRWRSSFGAGIAISRTVPGRIQTGSPLRQNTAIQKEKGIIWINVH